MYTYGLQVYIRNDRGLRSMLTGQVLAFDKHFNLLMKDVSEIFVNKRKYKSAIFEGKSSLYDHLYFTHKYGCRRYNHLYLPLKYGCRR